MTALSQERKRGASLLHVLRHESVFFKLALVAGAAAANHLRHQKNRPSLSLLCLAHCFASCVSCGLSKQYPRKEVHKAAIACQEQGCCVPRLTVGFSFWSQK